jgi:hypothetical protein
MSDPFLLTRASVTLALLVLLPPKLTTSPALARAKAATESQIRLCAFCPSH